MLQIVPKGQIISKSFRTKNLSGNETTRKGPNMSQKQFSAAGVLRGKMDVWYAKSVPLRNDFSKINYTILSHPSRVCESRSPLYESHP